MDKDGNIIVHENDILLGRGGNCFKHGGNETLRNLARFQVHRYSNATKAEKSFISREILDYIKNIDPPGRFLKKKGEHYEEVEYEVAREKASQSLRDAVSAANENKTKAPPQGGSGGVNDMNIPPERFHGQAISMRNTPHRITQTQPPFVPLSPHSPGDIATQMMSSDLQSPIHKMTNSQGLAGLQQHGINLSSGTSNWSERPTVSSESTGASSVHPNQHYFNPYSSTTGIPQSLNHQSSIPMGQSNINLNTAMSNPSLWVGDIYRTQNSNSETGMSSNNKSTYIYDQQQQQLSNYGYQQQSQQQQPGNLNWVHGGGLTNSNPYQQYTAAFAGTIRNTGPFASTQNYAPYITNNHDNPPQQREEQRNFATPERDFALTAAGGNKDVMIHNPHHSMLEAAGHNIQTGANVNPSSHQAYSNQYLQGQQDSRGRSSQHQSDSSQNLDAALYRQLLTTSEQQHHTKINMPPLPSSSTTINMTLQTGPRRHTQVSHPAQVGPGTHTRATNKEVFEDIDLFNYQLNDLSGVESSSESV